MNNNSDNKFLTELQHLDNYNECISKMVVDTHPTAKTILDFGAGLGTIANLVSAQTNCIVDCWDPTLDIQINSKYVRFLPAEPPPLKQYDLVYSTNVLEHIENDVLALKQLHQLTKPDGKLAIFVPACPKLFGPYDKNVGHHRRYTVKEIQLKIRNAGFGKIKTSYFDVLGAVLYFINQKIFRSAKLPTLANLKLFDHWLFPVSRRLDNSIPDFFGKNLYVTAQPKRTTLNTSMLSIVIPCLNEENSILSVIADAKSECENLNIKYEVIVIDNSSDDKSVEIAKKAGARVILCSTKGYGSCLKLGFIASNGEHILMLDADYSYRLENLVALFDRMNETQADAVSGSRLSGWIQDGAMPVLHRYLGTPMLSKILYSLFGLEMDDVTSGMKLFKRESLTKIDLKSIGFEAVLEIPIACASKNLKITETPIVFYCDSRGRKPHLHTIKDGLKFCWFILMSWLKQNINN